MSAVGYDSSENFSGSLDVNALVDAENGWIDRRVFWDEAVYRLEIDRIFRRCWLFVAHESQIEKPGDFLSTYMGEDNVLVVRQRDNSIRVLINSCPHRGNRVCHVEFGKARNFVCNYHGWSFGLNGELLGVHESEVYDDSPGFDMNQCGLPQAAKVASYKGLVFATFNADAPTLDDYLGDFRWYLDIMLDNDEGGTEFLPGSYKHTAQCNWKVPAENFVGDALHAGWTHDSGARAMIGTGVASGNGSDSYHINVNGHGWQCNLEYPVGNAASMGDKRILNYLKERDPAVRERLGPTRAKMLASISSAFVFPNFLFLPGQSVFQVSHPRGPRDVELHSWALVNRNAPAEIKEAYRKGVMLTFSPGGIFLMDDGENWEFVTRTNRGTETRKHRLHYGLGLHSEIEHDEMPGQVYRGHMNDANQRAFYRHWVGHLGADHLDIKD